MKGKEPSRYWWLRRRKYIAIFLRELSSVFILAYVLLYLLILSQVETGGRGLVSQFAMVPFVALSVTLLAFSLYHSITWFLLLPRIQPMKIGTVVLSGKLALTANLGGLVVASLLIASLVYGVQILSAG